jgi:ubiquinone/menaquinone biosynthesis C-methylase UbiE
MKRDFTTADARRFYDRFGSKQDLQSFYENSAIEDLIAHADFEHARAVFELGFGTGKLARLMLERCLPPDAIYSGIDISTTMARLAVERLQPWQNRTTLKVGDASKGIDLSDASFDRFVSTYVLDLLRPAEIRGVVSESYRILKPGGRLCLVSLSQGIGAWGRIVTGVWKALYRTNPQIVGGCRPIELLEYITNDRWRIIYHNTVVSFGISSEIVIASR